MSTPTPHPHRDLILQWANDPEQKVWYRNAESNGWKLCLYASPPWLFDNQYFVGEEKPREQVTMAGYTFDKPLETDPAMVEIVFYPHPYTDELFGQRTWTGSYADRFDLENGFLHLSKEAAIAHCQAMISGNKKSCGLGEKP